MASTQRPTEKLKPSIFIKEISCPVSLDIFYAPVLLDCLQHSVEEEMANRILASTDKRCPCCRKAVTKKIPNRSLKNIVEAYLKEHPEYVEKRYKPTSLIETKPSETITTVQPEQKHPTTEQIAALDPLAAPHLSPEEMNEQRIILQSLASSQSRGTQNPGRARGSFSLFRSPILGSRSVSESESQRSISYNNRIKIVLVGNSSVNKSGFLLKFADDSSHSSLSTIGIDFKRKTIRVNGRSTELQIWDTAGQERFRTITTSYYKGAQGIMLMYDVTDRQSFDNIQNWYGDVQQHVANNISILLIGTGIEEATREVSTAEGQALASELEAHFFECSISGNINIAESFISLTKTILERQTATPVVPLPTPSGSSSSCIIL